MHNSKKKPNILQLIGEFTSGGAETLVVNLTNALKRDNWNVIVSARKDGPLSKKLTDKGCVYFIKKQETMDLKYVFRLVSLIKKHKIDLIHSHLFGNNLFGFIASRLTRTRIIQTIHGMDSLKSKKRIIAYKIMSPYVDKIVTVSKSLEQEMLKVVSVREGKICTINNGIDIRRGTSVDEQMLLKDTLGIKEIYPIIGAVGNIKPVKGYDTFIRAAHLILKQYPNAQFLIVGDYSDNKAYKEELIKLTYELGMKESIGFLGYRQDADKLMSLFDVYTISSLSEGLSMALLEAMSLKRPIVATDVGGNSIVLESGKTGVLVPPGNPESLARGIISLISNKELSETVAKNAFEHVKNNYSSDSMFNNYKELYLSII